MVDQQRVFADDLFSIILFPLQAIWFFIPTALRSRITAVPWETAMYILKIVWTFMAYYWIYTMLVPYFGLPSFVSEAFTIFIDKLVTLRMSFWAWYSSVQISPFSVLFPGVSLVTWLGSKCKPKPKPTLVQQGLEHMSNLFYVPEKAVKGSELIPSKELPSFVCFIVGVYDDDSEVMIGCGFRVENCIMTAAHNLTGFERLKIISNVAQCLVDVDKAVVFHYDDFAYFSLSDRDFSMLGMSKGRLLDHSVPKSYPMVCQVFGPGTPVSFTMGTVVPVPQFGKVTYSGSTTHGFSGSPYVQNKTIVGMHLGAGMVNLGLDAAYIRMLCSIRQESTEDWLMDMIEEDQLNKREVKWERSPMDPSEIYVHRQGKYFTLDADTFFTVYKPQAIINESKTINDKLPTFVYSDSKNDATAPARQNAGAGANGQISAIRNCVQTPLTADSYPIPTSIKTLEETLAMESQEQTPAELSNPLSCTLTDSTYQPERKARRALQKWKKQGKSLQKSTNPGSPGLELIR